MHFISPISFKEPELLTACSSANPLTDY